MEHLTPEEVLALARLLLTPAFKANLFPHRRMLNKVQVRRAVGNTIIEPGDADDEAKSGFLDMEGGQAVDALQEIIASLDGRDATLVNKLLSCWQDGLVAAVEKKNLLLQA